VILVTVGTQFFDKLIEEVDRLAGLGALGDSVFAQIGLARRLPRHIDYVAFDPALLDKARSARLIITHAGTGSLCEFIDLGRPFIAVVNQTKTDNHQLEFLRRLSQLYDFCWIDSPGKLAGALPQARPATPLTPARPQHLADDIRDFLRPRRPSGSCQQGDGPPDRSGRGRGGIGARRRISGTPSAAVSVTSGWMRPETMPPR